MKNRKLMLGNEALAQGLLENGCAMATSYPGTPASEILSSVVMFQQAAGYPMHAQWAVNEKVAFEIAYAGCMTGLRTAVSMKQVGLNVASDPLMSAAYMGTKGGFIVISADDPGPHSSQTEQDSRMMAMMAKIPVLDPDSPQQAKEMTGLGYALSEAFRIPVMIRPTTRICHSRQDVSVGEVRPFETTPDFQKDPARWAATPKFRFQLHGELEEKLAGISAWRATAPVRLNPEAKGAKALVVSGVAAAHAREVLQDLDRWETLPLYQVLQPFPLHKEFVDRLLSTYDEILVLEETTGVIEMQLADRNRIRGKLNGTVSRVGELLPETVEKIIGEFSGAVTTPVEKPAPGGRRPTLCAGCPHRASFFAIKKAAPKGIYTSDIGCYTLGLNLGAVDTVLCMGAAVSQAAGFFHAYKNQEKRPPIVATLGDSTFFHAGVPPLIDAVVQKVGFVLVILDNRTTAMTGSQPTPASGLGAAGEPLNTVDIETLVRGCGVRYCKTADPYDLQGFTALMKEAVTYSRNQGPAVAISRHPCLLDRGRKEDRPEKKTVRVGEDCDGCAYCVTQFECPALVHDEAAEQVRIDRMTCSGCGACLQVCPKGAIEEVL
ncbi:MAG: thiamine pyrophosphate-dependent enzyme [Thermodesulfobacteriota bacterium]